MSQHLELFAALAQPFEPDEVRARPQGGRQLQYITARTVMNRLDDVLGPANWWDDYLPQEHSVICRLTIRLPDGTTLTKSDAGGYAGMSDSGDDDKSGFSDAFKRAAVKFGVGRYLYRDGVPRFLREQAHPAATSGEPQRAGPAPTPSATPPPGPRPGADDQGINPPQTGKALFAWIKQQEEKLGPGLLRIISEWGQGQDFPSRMVQWNTDQVHEAYFEACLVTGGPQDPARPAVLAPARGSADGGEPGRGVSRPSRPRDDRARGRYPLELPVPRATANRLRSRSPRSR